MYLGFTIPELIILVLLFSLSLGMLIAALNKERINFRVEKLYYWFENGYDDSSNWFTRMLYGVFLIPSKFAANLNHDGWRSGLIAASICSSVFIFFALLGFFIFIGISFLVIVIVLWLLGSILGSGSK